MDPGAGPVEEFAFALRQLREAVGKPTYRELAGRCGYSATALKVAARGERLPSLAVTVAFAEACGGDVVEWERRWRAVAAAVAAAENGDGDGDWPPYLGLATYDSGDAGRFFGRDRLVAELLDQLRGSRFGAVVGPSGSGKSSLLRAGVVPAARKGGLPGGHPVVAVVFTPGPRPLTALRQAMAAAADCAEVSLPARPAEGGEPSDAIEAVGAVGVAVLADGVWGRRPGRPEVLLVVDQFEEIFTLCTDAGERTGFIDALLSARAPDSGVRVLVGLRADFYGHCAGHRGLADALRGTGTLVGPMTAAELREVIVKPAAQQQVMVDPALVTTIIADAGQEPGTLPLVSHVLRQTWQRRRGKALTMDAYQAAGGLHGAIAHTAEAVYTTLTETQQQIARRVLLRLITVDDRQRVTRRPLPHTDVPDLSGVAGQAGAASASAHTVPGGFADTDGGSDVAAVLDQLATARLITVDEEVVQLAHEAVITAWPRLTGWVEADREGLRIHQQLTEATRAWRELGRDSGALYRGTRLAIAQDWAGDNRRGAGLTTAERTFLNASVAASGRRTRRLRALTAVLTVLLVAAVGAGLVAVRQRGIAEQRLQQAQSRDLAGQARAATEIDPVAAARLALRAWQAAPTAEARGAVLSTAAAGRYGRRLAGHTSPVKAVALSADGRLLVSGARGGTPESDEVVVWDTSRGVRLATLGAGSARKAGTEVEAVALSPDGRWVAVGGVWGGVDLWDRDGRRHQQLKPADPAVAKRGETVPWIPEGDPRPIAVGHVAFSPDGRQLAAALVDSKQTARTVTIWDLATGKHATYQGQQAMTRLSQQQSAWLQSRTTTGTPDHGHRWPAVFPFDLFPGYSGNGRAQVQASLPAKAKNDGPFDDPATQQLTVTDQQLTVTDTLTGRPLFKLPQATAAQTTTWALSPDGNVLYTGDLRGNITLWDVPRRARSLTLPAAATGIADLAVSHDERFLVAAGHDGTITVFDRAAMPLIGHAGPVIALAYTSGGHRLVSVGADSTARQWDPTNRTTPTVRGTFIDTGGLESITPTDGDSLFANPHEMFVSTHGTLSEGPKKRLDYLDRTMRTLAYRPDGQLIAALHDDGGLTVNNLNEGDEGLQVDLGDTGPVTSLAFNHPTLLARGHGQTATLTDTNQRPPQPITLPSHPSVISALTFSPDQRKLAAAGHDGRTVIWDLHHRTALTTFATHTTAPRTLAFSPNGHLLALAGPDRTITIWDLTNNSHWATLTGHTAPITALAFHPNGTTLATGSADHTITLWPLHPPTALHHLQHPTTLTPPN